MPPPHESGPTTYNLSHVPELIHPAVFRHQCSSHKHPMKSVVLLRQSAAHNQLFIFAPSITQSILKKTKKAPVVLRNIQIFTTVFIAHYKISYKSLQHIMYKFYPNTSRSHRLARCRTASLVTWSCAQLAPLSPRTKLLKRCGCPTRRATNSLWVGISAGRSQFFL